MKKFLIFLFLIFTFATPLFTLAQSSGYAPNVVILKLQKNTSKNILIESLNNSKLNLGNISVEQLFADKSNELSNIYKIKYSNPYDAKYVAKFLSHNRLIKWSEPDYVGKLSEYIPNDPYLSSQWYLTKINMENAWDIERGDGSVIVAVIDNGISLTHPDLTAQIWTNENETPSDGIDNDNNGFVDDVNGWDFGDDDADISHDGNSYHGTQVAGLIGATTDNELGIASVGYNVKIMGLKITEAENPTEVVMSAGYSAIIYAVDNGAKVINCSWGNYNYSHLGEISVNYAMENNVIVIAAAGNDGRNQIFYPARYQNVIAVAASDSDDVVWSNSNYGYDISLVSPGVDILSVSGANGYETASGTSLSAPLVSGVASLLVKKFPPLSAFQIAERLRVSSDNIYSLNPSSYNKLLGKGRLNAFNALNNDELKSVRMISKLLTDNNDEIFLPGDTIKVKLNFKNYLNPIENFSVSLVTDDPYVTIISDNFSYETIDSDAEFNNFQSPFVFTVNNNMPENHTVHFLLNYSYDNFDDFQWFEILINPSYADININNLDLTITSSGMLGYDDYPYNSKGNGLTYKNDDKTRFFEAGFMYGISETQVMDALHKIYTVSVSNDFETVVPFTTKVPGRYADQEGYLVLNDNGAEDNKLNITTKLFAFAYSDEVNNDYIILKYSLINNNPNSIENFYTGLFFDWDLDEDDYADDYVYYDNNNNYGYSYDSGFNTLATYQGVALISDENYNFWANVNDGSDDGINLDDFTDAEKWIMLSSGLSHTSAGPNDVSCVISGGPYEILPFDTLNVAFAIGIADSLTQLTEIFNKARTKYSEIPAGIELGNNKLPDNFSLFQNYPNPFNPTTIIEYSIPTNNVKVRLSVFDILGKEIKTLVNKLQNAGKYSIVFNAKNLSSGIYFYRLKAGNFIQTKKMILIK